MQRSFTLRIESADEVREFICHPGQSIVQAMARQGASEHPAVGCRNGGCGVCKMRITGGEYTLGRMSLAELSERERQQHIYLACRVYPTSDLNATFIGRK